MSNTLSIVSWNVEHFRGDPGRIERVVQFLKEQDPDVFALYEIEGKDVFRVLMTHMPEYSFHITEGENTQEILAGVRRTLTSFVSQRTEYRSGVFRLRPGLLVSVSNGDTSYSILFMHTKSGDAPRDLGLRDDMFTRAAKFRKVLDRAPGADGSANYLFVGDFNTMGMRYRYNRDQDIDVSEELEKLEKMAARSGMRHLAKDEPFTFWNGTGSRYPRSDLDHVFASDHLIFTQYDGADVAVRGWPKEGSEEKMDQWIDRYSDHALLYLKIQEP
jgi:endonuclease/exonuclease/phosphatase family metal-dependent hydrolase